MPPSSWCRHPFPLTLSFPSQIPTLYFPSPPKKKSLTFAASGLPYPWKKTYYGWGEQKRRSFRCRCKKDGERLVHLCLLKLTSNQVVWQTYHHKFGFLVTFQSNIMKSLFHSEKNSSAPMDVARGKWKTKKFANQFLAKNHVGLGDLRDRNFLFAITEVIGFLLCSLCRLVRGKPAIFLRRDLTLNIFSLVLSSA